MKNALRRLVAAAFLIASGSAIAQEKSPLAIAFERLMAGDNAVARGIVEPLAAEGDPEAQHMLGYMEERGLGGPKNLKRALQLYAEAAASGSQDAQFALGELAFLGDGVKKDYKRAAGWFTIAAEKGHVQAKVRLGVMHAEGLGFEPDRAKAVAYFKEAAELGDAGAQYNVGVAYLVGQGVEQSYKEAAAWFEKSAEQGSPDAQYNLALLYDSNFLGPPQADKTAKWMSAAAEAGLPAAYVAMGLMVHDGRVAVEGGEKEKLAADWFERAARAGDPQGQYLYAVSIAEGDGRDPDPEVALVWLNRALAREEALLQETRESAENLKGELEAYIASTRTLRE